MGNNREQNQQVQNNPSQGNTSLKFRVLKVLIIVFSAILLGICTIIFFGVLGELLSGQDEHPMTGVLGLILITLFLVSFLLLIISTARNKTGKLIRKNEKIILCCILFAVILFPVVRIINDSITGNTGTDGSLSDDNSSVSTESGENSQPAPSNDDTVQVEPPTPTATPERTPDTEQTPTVRERVEIPSGGVEIFNGDGIDITAERINRNGIYVSDVDFTIRNNNSIEKSVEVFDSTSVQSIIRINNYSIAVGTGFGFRTDIAAEKTARKKIEINENDAKLFDIRDIHEFAIDFVTYENGEMFRVNEIHHATSVCTLSATDYDEFTNGVLVFSNESADVYACGFESDLSGRLSAVFAVKNKLNKDTLFMLDSISVNGFMQDRILGEFGKAYTDTYRAYRILLDDGQRSNDVFEIEFRLEAWDFGFPFSGIFDSKNIGIVTVEYQNGTAVAVG